MWTNTLPTHNASVQDGKGSRKCAASKQKRTISSTVTIVYPQRETLSRILNSLTDENTLLGFIVWGIFMAFVGILLAFVSLAPEWMIIVMALACIPYIFGACKE